MRRSLDRFSRLVLIVAFAALAAGMFPAGAWAHSFLIRSQPEAGSRLPRAPKTMTLDFSEPFVRGTQQVTIRRASGHLVQLPRSRGAGAAIDQPLPASLRGVFIVSWRVLSDDGHISRGEFAFAVGSAAALPTVRSSSQTTSWSEVAASWLVFIGLALGLGGLVSERLVWRRTGARQTVAAAPVVPGVILAVVGGLLELVLLAGDQRGGGFASGLRGRAIANALGTRPGKLTLAILIALAIAGVFARLRWLRVSAIVPLLAAVVFNAARGHSGTSGFRWAVVADSVHLAAVAVWVGALAQLVLVAVRADEPRPAFVDGAQRYARFALPTVMVILASGVLTALPEFRSVGAVVSSSYGRTLLIKSGLIGVALLFALTARLRALPANPRLRLPLLRRLTLAEATAVAAVMVAAAVLANAAPPRVPAAAQASTALLGPPAVSGPTLRLADLAGQLVVGLTAGARELQFSVFPPGYQSPGKLKLTADVRRPDGTSLDLYPRPCGSGCFAIRFSLPRGVTVVRADASSSEWTGGKVRFPIRWPLTPQQPALVRRVAGAMRAVRSLTLTERAAIGYGRLQPAATQTLSGRQFMRTDEVFGRGAIDVRSVGVRNGSMELVFIVPGSNAFPGSDVWYRIWIDRRDRVRQELIVSQQGRILRTFCYGSHATGRG